jgi:hypothetical protein
MVIVVIIATLLVIVLPNFALSRHAAHTKGCLYNLRQIHHPGAGMPDHRCRL